MRRESRSMTSSDAPTMGARSILLMMSRSERVMPGPALARNLVARGNVDHVEREVGQLRTEGGGQIVAAAFDENHVEVAEATGESLDRLEIDRCIFPNCRMRTAAGFDTDDALGRKRLVAHQERGVLLRVDVVGHHGDFEAPAQRATQGERQGGLARANRAADAHPQRLCAFHPRSGTAACIASRGEPTPARNRARNWQSRRRRVRVRPPPRPG